MRVVGYIRVSTEEQAEDGFSLQAQTEKIRGYCSLYGHELVEIIVDGGVSGKTLNRPGLARLLAMLEQGDAEGVVIAALDRMTRSVQDWNTLIDVFFGDRARTPRALMSVSDHIDTRTAGGRLVMNILVSVAQWQREYIVERTSQALRHKMANGERVGAVSYGFDLGVDGVHLVPNAQEQEIIGWILAQRLRGWSLRAIVAELNRLPVPTKTRKGPWRVSAVAKILERTPYPAQEGELSAAVPA